MASLFGLTYAKRNNSLGYCELYLTLAYLFRRFDVRADPAK